MDSCVIAVMEIDFRNEVVEHPGSRVIFYIDV